MINWNRIRGHNHIKKYFINAINSENILHSYIISGEKGSGKKSLVNLFATALLCDSGEKEPCMCCDACKKSLAGAHPDIIHVNHEKPGSISVDEIRKQLITPMLVRPYYGKYKIFIIDEAHLMTPQAQNALLKTLEEPPSYGIVFLLTENEDMLLQTILSRTVKLYCGEISKQEIKRYLIEEKNITDYKAEICAMFAQGNVGKSIAMATDEDFYIMKESVIDLIKMIAHSSTCDLLLKVKSILSNKDKIEDYLNYIYIWYHDVLMYKSSGHFDFCLYADQELNLSNHGQLLSFEGLKKILDAIEHARTDLKANVNFELVMEVLFVKIKENYV